MSPSDDPAKALFLDAIENHPPDQWETFLNERCGDDHELRRRVWTLLMSHQGTDSFFDQPPITTPLTVSESPGETIGNYKLLQQIGEGGFGVVFMAEQSQPVRRKVALKVIKPGMDTKEVVARFEAERQALAILDHPNIAKVFDAGATDSGRPFFVMELVKGVPLTKYADANHLSMRERLLLFASICRAVHHAHQKGIIHRDLKPSNVLVTLHDGIPVPKIIDFGVSKAINQPLTEKTMFTQFGQVIGTPQYMSPEQAELSGLDIDTRSDVYSLGVILYELLTGQTPFTAEQIRAAGLDEMRRFIREQEPLRPSNILQTFDADTATIVASHRSSKPEQLRKSICGELDWIVLKALEKDRHRRYDTASNFADDVDNHLNQQPVNATPPTLAYQCWKLYQRYHSAIRFALAIGALLIVGITSTTAMWRRAENQREMALAALADAEQQRRKVDLLNDSESRSRAQAEVALRFLIDLLSRSGTNPQTGHEYTVSEVLSQVASSKVNSLGVQTLDHSLSQLNPKVAVSIALELGKSYVRANKKAQAAEQFQSILSRDASFIDHRSAQYAETLRHFGELENDPDKVSQSIEIFAAIDDAESTLASRTSLGRVLLRRKQFGQAENTLLLACREFEALNPTVELIDLPHLLLSRVYQHTDAIDQETAAMDAAIAIALKSYGNSGEAWKSLGFTLEETGRTWEAEFALRVAAQFDAPYVTYRLATVYRQNGNLDRAIQTMRQSYDSFASQNDAGKSSLRAYKLGEYHSLNKDYTEAARWSVQALDWGLKTEAKHVNGAMSQLLTLANASPQSEEIATSYLDELRKLEPAHPETAERLANTLGFASMAGYHAEPDVPWKLFQAGNHVENLARRGFFDAASQFGTASCQTLKRQKLFYSQSWMEQICARLHYPLLDFEQAVPFLLNSADAASLSLSTDTDADHGLHPLEWANFELSHIYHWSGQHDKAKPLANQTIDAIERLNQQGNYAASRDLDPFCIWQLRVIAAGEFGARSVIEEARTVDQNTLSDHVIYWMNYALGMAYEETGATEEAIDAYATSIRTNHSLPVFPQYHFDDRIIQLLKESGQLDRGREIFTEALNTRRTHLPDRHPLIGLTRLRLAEVMIRSGEGMSEALKLLDQARETLSMHQLTPQHLFKRIDQLSAQANAS